MLAGHVFGNLIYRWFRAPGIAACIANLVLIRVISAQDGPIDIANSRIAVRVYKAGLFSMLGHDHEIAAPIAGGRVNIAARTVELHWSAKALFVQDENVSAKDRAEIQRTMLGAEVLDAEHYPLIIFRSTEIESASGNSWRLRGNLTLHGKTRPVLVDVQETGEHYVGSSRFRQTEFGIKPIKVAGGTIRVKDEVRIEFDIRLAP